MASSGVGALPYDDWSGASRLKYLRNRSLSNPKWLRDADYLLRYVTHGYMRWTHPSPVESELERSRAAIGRYKKSAAEAPDSDALWIEVLASIDTLLDRCDELNEGSIPGRAP